MGKERNEGRRKDEEKQSGKGRSQQREGASHPGCGSQSSQEFRAGSLFGRVARGAESPSLSPKRRRLERSDEQEQQQWGPREHGTPAPSPTAQLGAKHFRGIIPRNPPSKSTNEGSSSSPV